MKTCIVALCIIGYTLAAQGSPLKTQYCAGNTDGNTNCSSCLNTGTQARQLVSNGCASVISNVVTDCLWYNPAITATKSLGDCMKCNSKDWLNKTDHATASSGTIACSDTALVAASCATKITNCDQSSCYTSTAPATSAGCAMCSSGYKGSGTLSYPGYPSCTAVTITNCDQGHPASADHCFRCKSGYMVSNDGATCVAFTTDTNCVRLGTGNTYCMQCAYGYIFNLLVCESSAKLIAFAGLAMALFFLN